MKKKDSRNWVKVMALGLMFLGIPELGRADLKDLVLRFQPYVSIQEEFTNNVDLTPKNKKEDYITTVSAGLSFSSFLKSAMKGQWEAPPPTQGEKYGIDLDYRLGLVFHAKETDNNFVSHLGNLKAWYSFTPQLTFRVLESLIRSDEQKEHEYPGATSVQFASGTFVDVTGLYYTGAPNRRSVYLRNVVTPSVEYKFSRAGSFDLAYRSNIYRTQSVTSENSREDFINPKLTYQFDIRNGIALEYGLTFGHFDRSPDFTSHEAGVRYTYRFSPRTAIWGRYGFIKHDSESTPLKDSSYDVHSPSMGVEYVISPTLTGNAQIGYFWYSPKTGEKQDNPSYRFLLAKRQERTTYTLFFQGGYREEFFTSDNKGFTLNHRASLTVSHKFAEKLGAGLTGTYQISKSGSDFKQKENFWEASGNATYQLLRWLSLSMTVGYRENHSNLPNQDYSEFRGLLRIEAKYR